MSQVNVVPVLRCQLRRRLVLVCCFRQWWKEISSEISWTRIVIPVPVQYCAPRVVSKAGETKCWTVQVGDIVCIQFDDANPQATFVLKQHENLPEAKLWHPFVVPWTICRILSLYQDNGGDTLMEIRWFYQPSDVPASVQNRMPPQLNADMDEVFETDHVEVDVPISKILGHVDLFYG